MTSITFYPSLECFKIFSYRQKTIDQFDTRQCSGTMGNIRGNMRCDSGRKNLRLVPHRKFEFTFDDMGPLLIYMMMLRKDCTFFYDYVSKGQGIGMLQGTVD